MKNKLWQFTDNFASFASGSANKIRSLYFPLCNDKLMSSVTPDLNGDIKTGHDSFLLRPVSRIDLTNLKSSRNFWVYIDKNKAWSAAGVSKNLKQLNADKFKLEAGLLWHKASRANENIGLRSEILSFVPSVNEPVEIMQVKLSNISTRKVAFTPTAAIPIYARSAENLRDHRHVTSLLQRIDLHKNGVVVKPTLTFDEAGHRPNPTVYFVLGWDQSGSAPRYIYPTQEMFCGEKGDLEAPESVLENLLPHKGDIQGAETMGAFRFAPVTLEPGRSKEYIIVMGIIEDKEKLADLIDKFNTVKKVKDAFEKTKLFWQDASSQATLSTHDRAFDNWFRWVSIQPKLRKIFGCSFLPDFDYGKGGRGWRDLWQDCLGLILSDPSQVRLLLIDNFSGVRIDGSNATIIGSGKGEFISDRNNISRVWMDHGVWPLLTLDLYINETGDHRILFEGAPYFRNHEVSRAREIDRAWGPGGYGQQLKVSSGKVYRGSILEHLLVQTLVQFYNVGSHNHVRLEGADWNDGLDMAKEHGESVAFSNMYAHNLALLSAIILRSGASKISICEELKCLVCNSFDYNKISSKIKLLNSYFDRTKSVLSGRKVTVDAEVLAQDLQAKSEWMMTHIRKKEWLKEGFFNGYYDNKKRRVEGMRKGLVRMILNSQVFPIMSGTALDWQITCILKTSAKYLFDKKELGYHLNTDFKSEQHDLGRSFSFVYGDKENGAFFNHMVVMFAYALYKRGYAEQGWKVLSSIYRMAANTSKSKIYPCLPEYFDLEGRGMYSYLTGSASWFVLTILTEAFGVKGVNGNLHIEPKLAAEQFNGFPISISRVFAGRRIKVDFRNPKKLKYPAYRIAKATLNSRPLGQEGLRFITIPRSHISKSPSNKPIVIDILLG